MSIAKHSKTPLLHAPMRYLRLYTARLLPQMKSYPAYSRIACIHRLYPTQPISYYFSYILYQNVNFSYYIALFLFLNCGYVL